VAAAVLGSLAAVDEAGDALGVAAGAVARGARVEGAVARAAVVALGRVCLDGARLLQGGAEVAGTLVDGAKWEQGAADAVGSAFDAAQDALAEALARSGSSLRELVDLDWRLDVEVAARHREGGEPRPECLLRVDTRAAKGSAGDTADVTSLYLRSDMATLHRVQAALEEAAAEVQGGHASRVLRYMRH
jgi:hypothetical protein